VNIIFIKVKNVYGIDLNYPVCDKAKRFAQLSGKKTLTDRAIKLIKELGYEIVQNN
jgi:hypothetical protein|tara:strand:+ start:1879 stop:2046 length:168 start_codon:yes stop_codon:yes gene_type:complete